MIQMSLYEYEEKCGCKITFDVTVEEDDKPPTYELWVHRIFGDDECDEHTEEYYENEWDMIVLPTSLTEIEQIAVFLNKFVSEEKAERSKL